MVSPSELVYHTCNHIDFTYCITREHSLLHKIIMKPYEYTMSTVQVLNENIDQITRQ